MAELSKEAKDADEAVAAAGESAKSPADILALLRALSPPPAPASPGVTATMGGPTMMTAEMGAPEILSRTPAPNVTATMGAPAILSRTPAAPGPAPQLPATPPPPGGDAVDAALSDPQAEQAYKLKQAISGVKDPALEAKRAEDSRVAAETQEIQDALTQTREAKQGNFGRDFLTSLVSPGGQLRAQQQAAANAPLQELLQKRELLGKVQADRTARETQARQAAAFDPDSDVTKQARLLAKAQGLPTFDGFTASQLPQLLEVAKLTGDQKKDALADLRAQSAQREAARHNRSEEAQQRYATDTAAGTARNAQEITRNAAEAKAAKGANGGKIPEAQVPKTAALAEAPDIYNQLEQAHNNVGLSGVTSFLPPKYQVGAQRDYSNLAAANSGAGSLATYPGAKTESAELMHSFQNALPTGLASDEKAHEIFQTLRDRANKQFDNTVNTLEAGGTSKAEIGKLREAHEAALRKNDRAGAATAPTGTLVRHGGKLYREGPNGEAVEVN